VGSNRGGPLERAAPWSWPPSVRRDKQPGDATAIGKPLLIQNAVQHHLNSVPTLEANVREHSRTPLITRELFRSGAQKFTASTRRFALRRLHRASPAEGSLSPLVRRAQRGLEPSARLTKRFSPRPCDSDDKSTGDRMRFSLCWRRPWPRPWSRVIVIVILVAGTARWDPDAALPLIAGAWIGGWAAAPGSSAPRILPAVAR
jgi:hypothetical protein